VTSGIRLGTPAVTTRGMKENQMGIIAELINEIIRYPKDIKTLKSVKKKVAGLIEKFPLYKGLIEDMENM